MKIEVEVDTSLIPQGRRAAAEQQIREAVKREGRLLGQRLARHEEVIARRQDRADANART